ncbi:MAG TPA: Do family serine endopeptidase [Bauldia sp.]|nr:Do family serine endopeptidase [Bauldia sp.]
MSARIVLLAMFAAFAVPAGAAERQVPATAGEMQLSFAPVVKRVSPAVVNVYASRTIQQQTSPFFSDPFFRQFFGDPFGGQTSTRVQRSLGSGVIIGADGLIVTNFHVIAQADEVKVALSDKREFAADIVLKDERSDLAVLKIKGNFGSLPVIAFADSDQVQVGDLVLAVGDPFGVGQTVTSGIVSAFARVPGSPNEDQYFIQTDAAINPGNSGGALVDMEGRLIGINRMIVSPSGASSGIGFAIPSNLVHTVIAAAATGAAPRRPWLGAELQSVTPELAASLNLDTPSGVLVASVVTSGPCAVAGMKVGDLVTSIDGDAVDDLGALNYRLATKPIGGETKLGVLRDGKKYTATVALEAAPETPPREKRLIAGDTAFAGLTVLNLSPAVAEELGYDGGGNGVIVSDVADNSNAAEAGFARGDVIAEINGAAITSTKGLADAVAEKRRYFDLVVKRDGRSIRLRMAG